MICSLRTVNEGLATMTMPEESAPRRARPSMADVARAAGVAPVTVSRVSNGQSNVDPATRQRVLESMRVLGYRPNSAARALKSGRFNTIGVITFTLETFGNIRTLSGIAQEAAHANCAVTLIPVSDRTLGTVSGAYDRLSEAAVDGVVIIFEAHLLGKAEFAPPPGVPVVVIDSNTGSGYTVVDTDQAQGAHQATEHLLSLGHKQVWHIAGPAASFSATHRVEAWQGSLRAAGITPQAPLYGDWATESGYRHGLTLGRQRNVTAIFAANDQMALGAMRALHELGRRIPADISVVGFDDMEEAHSFWPPLTTVRQDFAAVGRLSVQKLLRKIAGTVRDINDKTMVPTELIIRASTGAPPN